MSVDPHLLEIIVCPECKGALRELDEKLACRRCRLAYPINTAGVPLLLADEATPYIPDNHDD